MKFVPLALSCTFLFGSSLARAEKTASEQCKGLFETWATNAKASLANEVKIARDLGFEKRSDAEAARPVDDLLTAARDLCARLGTMKAVPDRGSNVETCVSAFSHWEDDMDATYSLAVFQKHPGNDDSKKLVPGQDVARREALLGQRLCHMLEPIH